LCSALVLIAWAVGCTDQPARRVVHVRVDDQLYSAGAALPGSTFSYPTRSLGDETRVVLRGRTEEETACRAPISAEIEVPAGGVLEFGYGLGDVDRGSSVEFSITASRSGKAVELFRSELGAKRGKPERDSAGWHDARVEIPGPPGRVRLEFVAVADLTATLQSNDGVPSCGFFSAPVVTGPSSESAAPDVVLISLDTLRADRLGIYGYPKKTSPNIDRIFGKGGVAVEHLYSNATNTLEGHAAMLTGLLPKTALTEEHVGKLARWETTLGEEMRARGYRTGAFTEDAWVAAQFGFWRGFERYGEERSGPGTDETVGYSHEIFAKGLEWLRAYRGQPKFLFLHTYEVHYPYTPRAPVTPEESSPRAVDSANYDAEIRYLDEQLGSFLDALEGAGLSSNAIVVVTADHGEEFGEHGRRYHGTTLHDEVLHVPALFLAPGRLPAGQRRTAPLQLVDLMPTILELAGIQSPQRLDGRSFAASLRDGSAMPARIIYHQADTALALNYSGLDADWLSPSYALTKWPYRLIGIRTREGHRYELFDLAADPRESDNLYERMKERFAAERDGLDRYEEINAERRRVLSAGIAAAGAVTEPASAQIDPKVREKMRALGYTE